VRKDFNVTISLTCVSLNAKFKSQNRVSLNIEVQIAKSGHRNELAQRRSLFVAHTVIYYVKFITLE